MFLSGNRPEEARRVADTAATALDDRVDEGDPELLSVWGGLNLAAAVASTRVGDADGARRYMSRAEDAASRLGEDRNELHTEFGPTNVALHAVSVSVELGDAARRCGGLPPSMRRASRPRDGLGSLSTSLVRTDSGGG